MPERIVLGIAENVQRRKQRTGTHGRRCDEVARHRKRYRREFTAKLVWHARTKAIAEPNCKKNAPREGKGVGPDEVYIVDYESLTAALPSDYNYDGEHWGCPWRSWENRRGSGYSCKGLANVVVSNIISHFLGCKSFLAWLCIITINVCAFKPTNSTQFAKARCV